MSPAEAISLKTFWDAVEGRLAACSADELRGILRAMAQGMPADGRQAFLAQLAPVECSPVEQKIITRIRRAKLFVFLRQYRHEIFDEVFQAELAQGYAASPQGQPPIPPAQLALATILQAYTGRVGRILSIFRGLTCCGRSPDRATTGTVGDRPELPPGLLRRYHAEARTGSNAILTCRAYPLRMTTPGLSWIECRSISRG